jgi:DNA-3-methyladenine glycosylase
MIKCRVKDETTYSTSYRRKSKMKGMKSTQLSKSFYERDPKIVARCTLGKILVRRFGNTILSGKIVETEAYYGFEDPASKAYRSKKLGEWMSSEPGTIFVYQVHGHWLFNIITEKKGTPSGILIRALEPLEGIGIMQTNRQRTDIRELTSGPGKLTKALGISDDHTGLNVADPGSKIIILENNKTEKFEIVSSHRIGVTEDLPEKLRFYIKNNRFVSR